MPGGQSTRRPGSGPGSSRARRAGETSRLARRHQHQRREASKGDPHELIAHPRQAPAPSPARRTSPPGSPTRSRAGTSTPASVRLHAVIGGDGPPLLLVHGWPETWYAWRLLMPALARDFEVIAVDQRGIGLSDKPAGGYDTGTLAGDLVALMDALGHERFAVVGHDTGFAISYALAADHPDRVDRVALAEIPGPPGAAPSPPVFVPAPINDRLWHIPFNRVEKLPEQLVAGPGGRLLRLRVRHPGREAARRRDRLLRRPALRPRRRCAAASGSTGRSTRRSRRTSSARPGR